MTVEAVAGVMVALLAGVALGAFFFGGLWLTLRRLGEVRHPALWVTLSLATRLAVVLAGFYFVADGQWQRMLAGVAGFLAARGFLVRRIRPPLAPHGPVGRTGER